MKDIIVTITNIGDVTETSVPNVIKEIVKGLGFKVTINKTNRTDHYVIRASKG